MFTFIRMPFMAFLLTQSMRVCLPVHVMTAVSSFMILGLQHTKVIILQQFFPEPLQMYLLSYMVTLK